MKSPDSVPRAAGLPPSDPTLGSPTSSRLGSDAPVPLRTTTRRRGSNHVPRPLNCFFLFKTDWLAKRKSILAGIEQDHRQLNRMASSEWRKLSPEAKQPFKDAAYQAKLEHSIKYPGYRFTPKPRGDRRKRKTKRNEPEVLLRNEEAARLVSQGVTGDALRDALAEYDRRRPYEKQHCADSPSSPPSLSEGSPPTPPAPAPVILHPSPFDENQSHSRAPEPTSFFHLDTLWDTFAESSHSIPWAGEVAQSQRLPVANGPQIVPAEPAEESHFFHFDHLPDNYPGLFTGFPPSYPTQLFQIGQEKQFDDWSDHLVEPLVGGTQETVSFPMFQSFKPSSGFVQSTSDSPGGSTYQSVPLFEAKNFSYTNSPMLTV